MDNNHSNKSPPKSDWQQFNRRIRSDPKDEFKIYCTQSKLDEKTGLSDLLEGYLKGKYNLENEAHPFSRLAKQHF